MVQIKNLTHLQKYITNLDLLAKLYEAANVTR